jgi:hypothetical protein
MMLVIDHPRSCRMFELRAIPDFLGVTVDKEHLLGEKARCSPCCLQTFLPTLVQGITNGLISRCSPRQHGLKNLVSNDKAMEQSRKCVHSYYPEQNCSS